MDGSSDLEARLRETERRAYEAEAAYATLLEQVPGAIYVYAPELGGPTIAMSAYIEELLGVPAERFLSGDAIWDELLHPDDRERAWADYESFLRTGSPNSGDYRYVRPDGRVVWIHDRSAIVRDRDGSPLLIQGVMFDITATKETALRMEHLAYHDVLTGLPNRAMFQDHLELALARARRHGHAVAVLFLDLDDFKPVNDTHGHEVGDEVLQHTARRIHAAARDTDLVARQGGDEFLVLLADLGSGDGDNVADVVTGGEHADRRRDRRTDGPPHDVAVDAREHRHSGVPRRCRRRSLAAATRRRVHVRAQTRPIHRWRDHPAARLAQRPRALPVDGVAVDASRMEPRGHAGLTFALFGWIDGAVEVPVARIAAREPVELLLGADLDQIDVRADLDPTPAVVGVDHQQRRAGIELEIATFLPLSRRAHERIVALEREPYRLRLRRVVRQACCERRDQRSIEQIPMGVRDPHIGVA